MLETPVYKVLARNDTGDAAGHQGGIVIPAEIEDFFPDVEGEITAATPTADVFVAAVLIVDGEYRGRVQTRYQYQTWGGTRSPERRLTSGLGPLRNVARAGDMVLFSRDPERPAEMSLVLLRQEEPAFDQIVAGNGGRRWGIVQGLPKPTGNVEIRAAEGEIEELSKKGFSLFDENRPAVDEQVRRKVRDAAFRKRLLSLYGANCLASGELVSTPVGQVNLDAAHIVSVEAGGSDDLRNGLLLSKDLHWAFDKGLFAIENDFSILISEYVAKSAHCEAVKRVRGRKLEFGGAPLRPHIDALAWHRDNVFIA